VRTAAAIATILGTIVHFSADAAGLTTVTTLKADVLVESIDPNVPGSVVVRAGEQVTIAPGGAPSRPRRLHEDALAAVGGCIVDFDDVQLSHARNFVGKQAVEDAMEEALADASDPDIAAGLGNQIATALGDLNGAANPEGQLTQFGTGAATAAAAGPTSGGPTTGTGGTGGGIGVGGIGGIDTGGSGTGGGLGVGGLDL